MSTNDGAPAPPPPGFDPGTNPKAAAKAAKAYAKASRPWYKKKRWWLAGVVVLIVIIAIATSGGGGSDGVKASKGTGGGSGSHSGKSGGSKGNVGTQKHPAPRGTAVQNKSAKYQILGVRVTKTIGPNGMGATAAGKFVVVDLSVKNVKNSSIQFSSDDVTLQVNGKEVDVDDNTFLLDKAFVFEDISPGLTKTGQIAFDVPAAEAGKGVLKAQAILSTDEPVYLKLK